MDTGMQVLRPLAGCRIRAAVLCSDGQTCCACRGPGLSLLWLFLLVRAKSKEKADEQMSRGFGFLHSCWLASLSLGVNLHSIPLCFTSNKWTPWAAFSSMPVGGQAVGTARCAETGAGVHGEWVTGVSLCYAAQEEMISCQLEQSPGAVLLHRQWRKAASLPFASTAVQLSCSYFHFSCMPSLRLQGFFCSDL